VLAFYPAHLTTFGFGQTNLSIEKSFSSKERSSSSSSRRRTRRSEEEEDNKYTREEDEEEQLSRNSIYLLASRNIPQIKAFHRGNAGFREFIREIRILLYFSNTLNLGRR